MGGFWTSGRGLFGACALAPRPGAGRPRLPGGARRRRAAQGMRGDCQAPPPRSAGAEAAGTSKPRRKPPLPSARRRPPPHATPRQAGSPRDQATAGTRGAVPSVPRARPFSSPRQLAESLPSRGGRGRGGGGRRLERRRGRGHDPQARAQAAPPPAGPGARAPTANGHAGG